MAKMVKNGKKWYVMTTTDENLKGYFWVVLKRAGVYASLEEDDIPSSIIRSTQYTITYSADWFEKLIINAYMAFLPQRYSVHYSNETVG